ncbi:MAG: hypothetical protein VX815_12980 [Gemmatimonadota bacterium]|nr:hypothetical protein [Gemmatimonadota bacterium]
MPRDAKSDPAGIPLAPRDFLILLILAEGPTHGYGVVTAASPWSPWRSRASSACSGLNGGTRSSGGGPSEWDNANGGEGR